MFQSHLNINNYRVYYPCKLNRECIAHFDSMGQTTTYLIYSIDSICSPLFAFAYNLTTILQGKYRGKRLVEKIWDVKTAIDYRFVLVWTST